MFNVQPTRDVPGFRVVPFEPGFHVDTTGPKQRAFPGLPDLLRPVYAPTEVMPPSVGFDTPYSVPSYYVDDFCRRIIEQCRVQCTDQYVARGRLLGSDCANA